MSDPILSSFLSIGKPKRPSWTPPVPERLDNTGNDWLSSLPSQVWQVDGVQKKFYTIGILAAVMQRDPVTIRSWEQKGWLPKAAFRTPVPRGQQIPEKERRGKRLYSEPQIRFLYEAYQRFYLADPKQADWSGFRLHIKQHYPKQ